LFATAVDVTGGGVSVAGLEVVATDTVVVVGGKEVAVLIDVDNPSELAGAAVPGDEFDRSLSPPMALKMLAPRARTIASTIPPVT
jgi:hypothetical protein